MSRLDFCLVRSLVLLKIPQPPVKWLIWNEGMIYFEPISLHFLFNLHYLFFIFSIAMAYPNKKKIHNNNLKKKKNVYKMPFNIPNGGTILFTNLDGFQSKLPPGILPHGLPQVKEVVPAVTAVEAQKEKETKPIRELSEEEKQMIMLTEDFQRFVDRTGRIMERALAESADIYADYTGMMEGEDGR